MSRFDVVCLHTIVGNPPASAAHFSTRADGHIYQSRDTVYRSVANGNGNHRVIAVENDDSGPEFGPWNTADGHAVPAFTPEQVEAIAQICAWAYATHGIPLVACPDSRPGSRGIGYHRQGIPGNFATYAFPGLVSGGEVWTEDYGKVCPGDARIAQLPQIITRARVIAGLEADEMEDDMQLIKGDKSDAVFVVVWNQAGAIAVRKRIPNENDPGFRAARAIGYAVRTVPQDVIDAIPDMT
ncbi:peptidoglycan recognition protein family protein [Actinophytocola oryzae]|uniref:N-acetylmuramoyl-L-alanine amidase n=1 Tax=Actinophytocola oryzae TaxID=502181 RepID=A0A4V3FV06_9PSEU|nr:N-acetylmuramoyl-L-alanine amidase [Actinophytocola oryzae]TDV57261.1 N-acetylmuramoyl-L-alanine amidase [Actinophytocola oryzae]